MSIHTRTTISGQLIIGFLLVFIGTVFLLDNMGYVESRDVLRYWPVALILFGVFRIIQAKGGPGWVAGGTWILFGLLFLFRGLRYIVFDLRDVWPLILVFIGVMMLWKTRKGQSERSVPDSNSTIAGTAVLGGMVRRNNSTDFRGGELTAVMGGIEADLSSSTISPDGAVIDVFALWGGVEVKIPPDWTVVSNVYPLLGGFEDETQPPKDDSKRLLLRGFAIMGGVGVKN